MNTQELQEMVKNFIEAGAPVGGPMHCSVHACTLDAFVVVWLMFPDPLGLQGFKV